MESQPFISVVIPTRNRLPMLKRTLACLEQQTYSSDHYEIIVVDNGSEDGTADHLRQLVNQGRLRYIRQSPLGPAVARNVGARAARGEVIAFTDDDCLPEAGWLAALAESHTSGAVPLPVAVGGPVENVSDGHWLHRFYAAQGTRHQTNHLERPAFLDTANASFRRSVFLAVGGFNEAYPFPGGEDVDLGFRFTAAGYELRTNPQAVVWHIGRTSLQGLMGQAFDRGRGDAMLMIEHPEYLAGPPSRGLRLQIRRILDGLLRLAGCVPRPARSLACGLAAALRRLAFALPETEYFVRTYLRGQVSRYRSLGLAPSRTLFYLLLEWCDHVVRLAGRIVGAFSYTYRQVHAGEKVLSSQSLAAMVMDPEDLRHLYAEIHNTHFDKSLVGVGGWLSPSEKRALYALALHIDGPILEIGSWVGLSTACIAYGIRDSGKKKAFVTTDLNPSLENFRQVGDRVEFFLPGDRLPRGASPVQGFKRQVEPILSRPGRAIGQLRQNLIRLGLVDLVTIVEGEFRNAPDLGYGFIFCDATHTPYEISLTASALFPFLSVGTILACHDVDQTNEDCLRRYISFRSSFKIDSLFVGRVANWNDGVRETRPQPEKRYVQQPEGMERSSNNPTVSVIIPTYNRAHLVGRAILSVLNQTYRDFELIIVDDASIDDTRRVVESFDDERIEYIRHGENRGAAAARNTGIEASRGKYVAFQDSDDEWLPEKLERQIDALRTSSQEIGVVYSSFWQVRDGNKRAYPPRMRKLASVIPSKTRRLDGDVRHALLRGNFVTTQAAVVRRECLEKVGLFDERLPRFQDWELWLRISRHYHFKYVDEPLVLVYYTPDSISASPSNVVKAFELVLEKHSDELEKSDELFAHYLYAMGDLACWNGELELGRGRLFRAVRLRPLNPVYWTAACASLFGERIYTKVTGLMGTSYVA